MKFIRAIALFLVLTFSCLITACSFGVNEEADYKEVIFDNAKEFIKEDFIEKNRTKNSYYYYEPEFIQKPDESSPKERLFLVSDMEEFNTIFSSGFEEFNVDFNDQTLIVFTFTTIYIRPIEITEIKEENNNLRINCELYQFPESGPNVGDATMQYQRWIVIKLDKTNIEKVVFTGDYTGL